MPDKIWLSPPHMGSHEQQFIAEAFDTNWITSLGSNVTRFEEDLCKLTGRKYAIVLNSATAAIHLALAVLGVKKDDIVLGQDFTFIASVNPILYQNGIPVFIDSEMDTWNMDPVALEEAIKHYISKGKKPKAIIPVDLYGMPAKMKEITAIGNQYEIPVIEDAAEAVGSTSEGKASGSFGTLGVLSFNGNKIITTSGGGALVTDDESLIKKALFLATQAKEPLPYYQHNEVGYNYRLSNILAGIGRGQMMVLDDRIKKRRENFEFYKTTLGTIPGVSFQPEREHTVSNRWLTCILVDPSQTGGITYEDIRLHLEKDNIESRPLWKPMHMQPLFKDAAYFGSTVSQKLFEQGLGLPSGSNLTTADLERIVSRIKEVLNR